MNSFFSFSNLRRRAPRYSQRAFTVLEALLVIALIGILSVGAIVSLRTGASSSSLSEAQATVLYGLERARSKSAAGMDGTDHGVYLKEHSIISFEGATYVAGTGSEVPFSSAVTITPAENFIIFKRLNAQASDMTITLTHRDGFSKTITITENGAITKN
ncbi:MAG: hypothetical protein A2667_01445 [Candidatus Wildermuthbacteria bacterium RIFCSPHIGHO2_01_FULL_47_27]|uniref:General secretion pathway GspH domain-containing protein n=2 Tax=Candidatus Wildermuthiibacteriota TaxID=1817923 RepID=A0A1G2RRI1_9BACT|nr:MAG: hypothetical protein UY15_C0012G0004 [Parcubacteria group bacterium GW2011_GWA2_47_9]OHA64255.1 MAG: hypothetical protein A2667_01445 [Candidatus Wildermuthbacteria bacterium RIFCSPHIGHO2_01_FULL_47_27]OHA67609.1 MAG: hypothetical protein A3D59_03515 [Candidatus Wildermuthbacteria bacterium RIFCSPHIGHO2_02_FULL_47_17]OHA75215.1 MAG: hypothetical protein A3I38_01550 [Candidatus Wildermuthbacteria bacterium RIFCSPLOWO2_02_FULL_47_10]OHA75453.1 MAG: hypothetical protein A3A32_02435 [Candid